MLLIVVSRQPAHAQFPRRTPQPPPVVQTPAQMAQDFRALGFVVPDRHWDYRNVDVVLNDGEGQTTSLNPPQLIQTRGWVLPGKKDAPRSFIAWNGWMYRARSVGQKADWRADARALIERAARDYPQDRSANKGFTFSPKFQTWTYEGMIYDDHVSLSFDALTPLKAVMLQLLGEEQLAKQAFLILKTSQKNSATRLKTPLPMASRLIH